MSLLTEKFKALLEIEDDVIESLLKEEFDKSFVYITGDSRDIITFSGHSGYEDIFKEFKLEEVLMSPLDDYKTKACMKDNKLIHQEQIGDMLEYLDLLKKVTAKIQSYLPQDCQTNKSVIDIGQILVDALRTIASGKKDYGVSLADTDYDECRKIAKDALRKVGCFNG